MGKRFISNKEPVASELTPGDVWESEDGFKTPFRKVWTGGSLGWSDAAVQKLSSSAEQGLDDPKGRLKEVENFEVAGTEADDEETSEEETDDDELTEGDDDDGSNETEISDGDGEEGTDLSASDDPKLSEGRKSVRPKTATKKKSRR